MKYNKLTLKAQVCLAFATSNHSLRFLERTKATQHGEEEGREIYEWFIRGFNCVQNWLKGDDVDSFAFYEDFIEAQIPIYNGYYNAYKQPREANAYFACLSFLYFSCKNMIQLDWNNDNNLQYKRFPSDIAEVDTNTLRRCLNYAQQTSENPKSRKSLARPNHCPIAERSLYRRPG
ncbi:MAG: hypothetical protein HC880_00585 [Bacteroidia bacterium]|nr:hypothetical protein [Bacteroidia bacterium]